MRNLFQAFRPDMEVPEITDIDLARLDELGIIGLLVDTDGTYTPLGSSKVSLKHRLWIRKTEKERPLLCTTCNNWRNVNSLIPIIGHRPIQRKKFEPIGRFFRMAAKMINCKPSQIAIVNDSWIMLWALWFFGPRPGYFTIKVNTIGGGENHSIVGFIYLCGQWIEKFILHRKPARS